MSSGIESLDDAPDEVIGEALDEALDVLVATMVLVLPVSPDDPD
ncbi:MAG: hypothetical protein AAGF11_23570 [Myxococcota bacterium]